jgi:hypothetical protein
LINSKIIEVQLFLDINKGLHMTFWQKHLWMLGIMGIFTGMIAPVVGNEQWVYAFPMTNLQFPTYIILLSLSIGCILLSVKQWNWIKAIILVILTLLGYMFVEAWGWEVRSNKGVLAPELSWGWIFIVLWFTMLMISVFHSKENPYHKKVHLSDHIIWWWSALTILLLTWLIISVSYVPYVIINNGQLLENIFWKNQIKTISWVTQTQSFSGIYNLNFDRKTDKLGFFTNYGDNLKKIPENNIYSKNTINSKNIWWREFIVNKDGFLYTTGSIYVWKILYSNDKDNSIVTLSWEAITIINDIEIKNFTWITWEPKNIWFHKSSNSYVWSIKTWTGTKIYINGNEYENTNNNIIDNTLVFDGKNIMYIGMIEWKKKIIKNKVVIEEIQDNVIEESIQLNGRNSIYAIEQDWSIWLVYNWVMLDRKFDEIREIYLEKNSDWYVYFGRPLWERTYCLYTRYRGNICWISGYMNPKISADGSSIIYAAIKDNMWWIYRNASPIISNTWYPVLKNIENDYVFFDITNPSYYVFIHKSNDWYKMYKKWEWVAWLWDDVGLDVAFWYDNKSIMSVKDDTWWKLIEF